MKINDEDICCMHLCHLRDS